MTDTLIALLLDYGAALVGLATYLSCLAVPIPASLIMLAAGAFSATGDLALGAALPAALVGALAGDQSGFAIGRSGRGWLNRAAARHPRTGEALTAARSLSDRHGGLGIFLSRWLFSPLGPYVNFTSGAMNERWARFTFWAAAGEVVWVSLYFSLGALFGANIEAVSEILSNVTGTLAAGLVTVVLGFWAFRRHH